MAFLEEFLGAVLEYPSSYVQLRVIDFEVVQGGRGTLNVGEVARFKVMVDNRGVLHMNDVHLIVTGENGAAVSNSPIGPFQDSFSPGTLDIPAHDSAKTGALFMRAPSTPRPAGTQLLGIRVREWDANPSSILKNRAPRPGAAEMAYVSEVHD